MPATAAAAAGTVPLGEWTVTRRVVAGPAWLATIERPGLVWHAWLAEAPTTDRLTLAVRNEDLLIFDRDGVRVWPASCEP
jgi:hypothetical protein